MKILLTALAVLAVLGAGLMLYIRLAPSDPARWHVDPFEAPRPEGNGWLVRPEGGNAAPGAVAGSPQEVLARLDAIARAWPRTRVLAGSVAAGRITYVTRSRLMGFPDYTSVAARPGPGGTALAIYARQRFGARDLGVNRARVEAWLAALGRGSRAGG